MDRIVGLTDRVSFSKVISSAKEKIDFVAKKCFWGLAARIGLVDIIQVTPLRQKQISLQR